MPTLVKGVVIERRLGVSRIKLTSGRRFWARTPKGIGIRDTVFVAWNYTKDQPSQILTKEQVENTPEEVGLEEPGVSRSPLDDVGEVDVEAEVRDTEFLEPVKCGDIEVVEVEGRRSEFEDGDDGVSRFPLYDGGNGSHHNN
jgi:hypothetical protein